MRAYRKNELEKNDIPFIEVTTPWIEIAVARLRAKAGEKLSLLSLKALAEGKTSLALKLSKIITPSLLVELKLKKVSLSLKGSTPRRRYLYFLKHYPLNPAWSASFFQEKPELKRFLDVHLDLWVQLMSEFLSRLQADLPLLENTFHGGKPLGLVSSFQQNAGDPHFGGRTVSIVRFANGPAVIYKPRDLAIVASFHSLLSQCDLKTYKVLPRGEYGWEEKVSPQPCQDIEAVKRYYKRAGALLCILYLLQSIDMHAENIVASGEYPILIDLETLFHSILKRVKVPSNQVINPIYETGLLPMVVGFGNKKIDISVFGADPAPGFFWMRYKKINTDEMEWGWVRRKRKGRVTYAVLLKGKPAIAKDHVDSILSGFEKMYRSIEKEKKSLFREFLEQTKYLPIRTVLRSTQYYSRFVHSIYHPAQILNPRLREEKLNAFCETLDAEERAKKEIMALEKEALLLGDIPCFHCIPVSTDLYIKGSPVVKDCLAGPIFTRSLARLEQLGDSDLESQKKLIRLSFLTKSKNNSHSLSPSNFHRYNDPKELAIRIGEIIKKQALHNEGVYWTYLRRIGNRYKLHTTEDDFYQGKSGIALFFAALGKMTQDSSWKELALECLLPLRKRIRDGKGDGLIAQYRVGGMSCIGGIIYALAHIGKLLNEADLISDAKTLIGKIERKEIQKDRVYDVMEGTAGLLLALLSMQRLNANEKIAQCAQVCGEYLCKKAKKQSDGTITWGKKLLGMSHGNAGISYALCKLGAIANMRAYREAAAQALQYERNRFSKTEQNWPDLRSNKPSYTNFSWCNGMTGMGFARLACKDLIDDPHLFDELEVAAQRTKEKFGIKEISLCCGTLGHYELIQSMSRVDKERSQLMETLSKEINHLERDFFHPGLMQGAAGIGYTLLRMCEPRNVLPQVLLFE